MIIPKHAQPSPDVALIELHPRFEQFTKTLKAVLVETKTDPLGAIVSFFAATSPWHDRGLEDIAATYREASFGGEHKVILERLHTLDTQLAVAGRNPFGWNQTKKNELVTPEKIHIGGTLGLPTMPVSYWVTVDPDEPPVRLYGAHKNQHGVVSSQAREFINSHAPIMIERVEGIYSQ